jgi:pSer/pThr/pTyr-binding forkhead associated (FHA) protein
MICPKCKKEISEDVSFCPHCNYQIQEDTVILKKSHLKGEEVEIKPSTDKAHTVAIKKGPSAGTEFLVEKEEITIGRDPASDIFLNDITVSRRHARIFFKKDEAFIEDLGSLNGIFVDGKRVEKAQLKPGAEIQIGKFKLVFFKKR